MARQYKLSRQKANRTALISNLASSLIISGHIVTTEKRAKATLPVVEKLLTKAQKPSLANHRYIRSAINQEAANYLINSLSQKLTTSKGGKVKLIKVVARKGDAADRASLNIITKSEPVKTNAADSTKKVVTKKTSKAASQEKAK